MIYWKLWKYLFDRYIPMTDYQIYYEIGQNTANLFSKL